MAGKVIISVAITGGIHTPTMSEALPLTPDQIANQSIAAAEAGAAIIHLMRVILLMADQPLIPKCSWTFCRASNKAATPHKYNDRWWSEHDS